MQIPIFQIDAFTRRRFHGNPAAVCVLENWLDDTTLQHIASENNLSETAFLLEDGELFHLRWFTPATEVDLCGHATLASAFVVSRYLRNNSDPIHFETRSGGLSVNIEGNAIRMDFPARKSQSSPFDREAFEVMLGSAPESLYRSRDDWMAVYADAGTIQAMTPKLAAIAALPCRGLIVTAPGEKNVDFESRFFAPRVGVPEDPVTGSAHCVLVPYWHKQTGKNQFRAYQCSPRGGELRCEYRKDRVVLSGNAVFVMSGSITID